MLNWVKQFNIFCYLDSHQYSDSEFECLLAINALRSIDDQASFQELDKFLSHGHWYLGHFSYDLRKQFYPTADKKDIIGFPTFHFFEPEIVIEIKENKIVITAADPGNVFAKISEQNDSRDGVASVEVRQRFTKDDYLAIVQQLQQHILRGNCYEINFCQQFFSEGAIIDPVGVFQGLTELSPTPFSVLYRLNDSYLISASPERFLKRTGNKIISQPMKGTISRDHGNMRGDQALKQKLYNDPKERAENVMVVDLVRNDLSRICKEGTVKVDELFGVYTFPQVHQMVSTVSGELNDVSFSEVVAATFPMGSMTGAPKQKVIELIDAYEPVSRGLFSGSVGYINPVGNFDFNVVIRSILYNQAKQYLAYYVGSGITFYSDAEKEWEECLLKASAIKKVLTT